MIRTQGSKITISQPAGETEHVRAHVLQTGGIQIGGSVTDVVICRHAVNECKVEPQEARLAKTS